MPGHEVPENTLPGSQKTGIGLDILDFQDSLPFYVLLVDEDHNIWQANKAVLTHLGVHPDDIIGKYCPRVVHGIDGPFEGCPLEESAKTGAVLERELFDANSGRWLKSGIYPSNKLAPNGKKLFFHMVLDITDRKQAEEQLKASHEQLRKLSAHLESVREEERKNIARDLHDETSQLLASLNAHLEAAIGNLPPEAVKTKAILEDAKRLSINVIDQVQKLIYEIRPLVLDDLGLVSAIRWLIENSFKTSNIKVKFKTTGRKKRLNRQIETTVFRVIQETISNIIKHANAMNVDISLHFEKGIIKATITDDGKGFKTGNTMMSTKNEPRGFGLLGMRERVDLINGEFDIQSRPSVKGTQITIEIPLS